MVKTGVSIYPKDTLEDHLTKNTREIGGQKPTMGRAATHMIPVFLSFEAICACEQRHFRKIRPADIKHEVDSDRLLVVSKNLEAQHNERGRRSIQSEKSDRSTPQRQCQGLCTRRFSSRLPSSTSQYSYDYHQTRGTWLSPSELFATCRPIHVVATCTDRLVQLQEPCATSPNQGGVGQMTLTRYS